MTADHSKKTGRKPEKEFYQPGIMPTLIHVPEFSFFSIEGKGNHNDEFAGEQGLSRISHSYRESYLSDYRRTAPEKLRTVLRFGVK